MKNTNSYHKRILFSTISALVLIVFSYFYNNLPMFTGENLDFQLFYQIVGKEMGLEAKPESDNCCYYNVAHDKQLVTKYNSDHEETGKVAITDRAKLVEFLRLVKESGGYRYVILDLMFDRSDTTEYDSELFDLIADMDRIVFVANDSIEKLYPRLKGKTAIAEYYATVNSGFSRYEYMRGNERYLPLKVYEDLNPHKTFSRYGWRWLSLYWSDGSLCQNSIFLTFCTNNEDHRRSAPIHKKAYKYITADVLNQIDSVYTEEDMIHDMRLRHKDKYIVIGDFDSDMHDTYVGPKAGSEILSRAIQSLEEGKHIVTVWHILFWFVVFGLVSFLMCSEQSVLSLFDKPGSELPTGRFATIRKWTMKLLDTKLMHFLANMVTYVLAMLFFQYCEYQITGTLYSLTLPLAYLGIVKMTIDFKNYKI